MINSDFLETIVFDYTVQPLCDG